ncbi:hypothetical protein DOTSEDRAFT_74721 [Dothistroma septosporum NZE10]|uniref:Uncharacterized protein n=1 Tax=Dothistroma septosporum (strain NZE10 / CBS 128990) TaxID=675120 RepID=N1PEC4_DOTSN|nr:hypothetical protein DOTSEDRAFT_74721 [Dothistroma septosporum NZE10]
MCEAIARHRRDLGAKRESAQQADKTDITLHLGSEPPTDDAGLPTTAADGKVDTQDGVPVPVDDEGQQDGEEMSSDLGDEVELVATRTVSESDEPDPFDGEDCGLYLLFAEGVGQGGMQEEKEVDGSEDGDRTPDQEQPSGLLAPPSSDTEDGEGLKQRHREVDTDDDDASEDEGQHRPAKRARTGERRWCAVM